MFISGHSEKVLPENDAIKMVISAIDPSAMCSNIDCAIFTRPLLAMFFSSDTRWTFHHSPNAQIKLISHYDDPKTCSELSSRMVYRLS